MNFPKTLLCGEVHPVSINFTNTGSSSLHHLKVALSNPKFFTLGSDHSDIPKFSGVYHVENSQSSNCRMCASADKDFTKLSRVMDIDIPGGTLNPQHTVTVPAWVRGNDIGGIHEVNFLFYYEPAQQMPKVRYVKHSFCLFVFNLPPTAKVIWRWGHGLKSHPTDWRSR